ncbi:hypothetical protein RhiLY_11346 [Ceratobasidium sp. AG-Ba]|nr:hypothetical protein RhiLY_04920 [Ceratobasidium sp. AG-Ba]QRW12347.1 hypothetical protein RhiLY_11346 [Ceratobasidium sp. AG-Ba]
MATEPERECTSFPKTILAQPLHSAGVPNPRALWPTVPPECLVERCFVIDEQKTGGYPVQLYGRTLLVQASFYHAGAYPAKEDVPEFCQIPAPAAGIWRFLAIPAPAPAPAAGMPEFRRNSGTVQVFQECRNSGIGHFQNYMYHIVQ